MSFFRSVEARARSRPVNGQLRLVGAKESHSRSTWIAMTNVFAWPRMMNPDMAAEYAGGKLLFDDLLAKELLKPKAQRKGFTRYDRFLIDAALDAWKGFEE